MPEVGVYDPEGTFIEDDCIYGPDKSSIIYVPCTYKGEFTIPETVTSIGECAFCRCFDITSASIPNTVTEIKKGAFFACNFITTLSFSDSVTKIGPLAFSFCPELTSVTIPASVCEIGGGAFSGCEKLANLSVAPESQYFTVIEGALYDKAETSLITSRANAFWIPIPNTVKTIEDHALCYCQAPHISIPNSVVSIGEYAFYSCSNLVTVNFPTSLTSIGNYAFGNCEKLVSPSLPVSLKYLGEGAFISCRSISSITVPELVTTIKANTFGYCISLKEVTIGSGVKEIGSFAFSGCNDLTDVICKAITPPDIDETVFKYYNNDLENTVLYVPEKAIEAYRANKEWSKFGEITSIDGWQEEFSCENGGNTVIYTVVDPDAHTCMVKAGTDGNPGNVVTGDLIIPEVVNYNDTEYTVIEIGNSAFRANVQLNSVVLPEKATRIGESAFEGCSSLATVTLPSSLKSIDIEAFRGSGLLSVAIPNSVDSIGERAFYESKSLASLSLGKSVAVIEREAFGMCTSLTSVEIPASVEELQNGAFGGCESLTSFAVDPNNEVYTAVDGILLSKDTATLVAYPNGVVPVVIPASVTIIGDGAFKDNMKITAIEIPDGVINIGEDTFYGCTNMATVNFGNTVNTIGTAAFAFNGLQSLELPPSVATIGTYAFGNSFELTSLSLPNSVTEIGPRAFTWSRKLAMVVLPDSLKTINEDIFSGCESLSVVTIGKSVEEICKNAFSGDYMLSEIICKAKNPPVVKGECFYYANFENATLCVPSQSLNIYSTNEYWGQFANIKKIRNSEDSFDVEQSNQTITFEVTDDESNTCKIADGSLLDPSNDVDGELTIPGVVEHDGKEYTVTEIGDYAFSGCENLTAVAIPTSVTSIGEGAFSYCSNLSAITTTNANDMPRKVTEALSGDERWVAIPGSVKQIGNAAFFNCSGISALWLPAVLESLGDEAFAGCLNISMVRYEASEPIAANSNVFDAATYAVAELYVPEDAIDLYKSIDPWKNFSSIESSENLGIEGILNDSDEYEVFNLLGEKLDASHSDISAGIYVVRKGNRVIKISIK